MYRVVFSPDAQKDVILLKKKAPNAFKKLMKIYEELEQHPRFGSGQCEQLKYFAEETIRCHFVSPYEAALHAGR